jgi:hypothetical protein
MAVSPTERLGHGHRVDSTGIIRPPVTALTAQNTDMVATRVQEGRPLVLPSRLQHSVSPGEAVSERVRANFNVMFTAQTESMSTPCGERGALRHRSRGFLIERRSSTADSAGA